MFAAAWPRSNITDRGASVDRGSGVTRAIGHGGPGEMAGIRPDDAQLAEVVPVAADDEVPALLVLRAAGRRPASRMRST